MSRVRSVVFDGSFACVVTFLKSYKEAISVAEPVEFVFSGEVSPQLTFPDPTRAAAAAFAEAYRMAKAHSATQGCQVKLKWPSAETVMQEDP